jgi:hypothetical protein
LYKAFIVCQRQLNALIHAQGVFISPFHNMQHAAAQADVAGSDVQQPILISLADLDDIVLIQILCRLPDPLPLAQTCKTMHRALLSGLCRMEWFSVWFGEREITYREPVYAAITWRATQQCNPQQLAQLVWHALQHQPQRLKDATVLQDASSYMKSGRWLELLGRLSSWQEHLLLMAAASSNISLLRALLGQEHDQQLSADHEQLLPQFASALQLQAPEEPIQQQQQQQHEQQMLCQTRFLQPLPAVLRLPNCRHAILQSALVCAARTGQLSCLQTLLQLLTSSNQNYAGQMDVFLKVAEVAAAAGQLQCLQEVLDCSEGSGSRSRSSSSSDNSSACLPSCTSSAVGLPASVQQTSSGDASEQQAERQQQQQQRSRMWQCSFVNCSDYLLVAAATSGSTAVLAEVLLLLSDLGVKQQLPAALAAAGRRGHLQVLQCLLQHPAVSSRPLQVTVTNDK